MANSPNVKPINTGSPRAAISALNGVEAGQRRAAVGASPEAKQMLADVQAGKMAAASLEPVDPGRISDAVVRRLDSAAKVPRITGANDPAA